METGGKRGKNQSEMNSPLARHNGAPKGAVVLYGTTAAFLLLCPRRELLLFQRLHVRQHFGVRILPFRTA